MSTTRSAFSERLFEFAFNAEYIDRNKAILVGAPDIPSQDEEKWLGYDVAFEIEHAPGITGSIALQHKVARLVDGPGSPKNQKFRSVAGNRYFAFPIDADQFNIIQDVSAASLSGIEFYSCAPLFVTRGDMNACYGGKTVEQSSLWMDVSKCAALDPDEPHSMVYSTDGLSAWVFSDDPQPLSLVRPAARERKKASVAWNSQNLEQIYGILFEAIDNEWPAIEKRRQRKRPRQLRQSSNLYDSISSAMPEARPLSLGHWSPEAGLKALSQLLSGYLGMSWLVETAA